MSKITTDPIDITHQIEHLRCPDSGATALFLGQIRNHNDNKQVLGLTYEAYDEMACEVMDAIEAEAITRYGLSRCIIVHRIGELAIGDVALFVGVSSAHRRESFEAVAAIVDEIKKRVPIWKKERYSDGSSWLEEAVIQGGNE